MQEIWRMLEVTSEENGIKGKLRVHEWLQSHEEGPLKL
jgi:hypothetical protein